MDSLARIPNIAAGEVARDGDVVRVTGVPYLAHGVLVPAAEIYFDGEVRPKQAGPWLGEADKVAWRDPATGYQCIILRARPGGFLGGYVGVPSDHPLHEFAADAIPGDLGVEVHGGVTYAAMCQDGPTPQPRLRYEARRLCHVVVGDPTITDGTDYGIEDHHAWWFGFTCDHIADVVPGDPGHSRRGAALGFAQTYRDDAYVYAEVVSLAAQLRAIAEGKPAPPRDGPPLPPLYFDPRSVS
ncbi:MAG: hypothetical protein ACRYFW_10815 [Janthinobacterium lividum]